MKILYLLPTFLSACSVKAFEPRIFSSNIRQRPKSFEEAFKAIRVPTNTSHPSPLFVAASADEATEWTKKRLHNTAAFRSLALLSALALAGFLSPSALPAKAAASLHLLSFATWFGSVAYTTFVAGITMFKNLPRQMFGKLQAKLFPKYFALGSVTLLLQLITLRGLPLKIKMASTKALSVSFVMTLLNQFYLEPLSTNNMMRRYELEGQDGGKDTDEYKTLKASFGKFHGMSSLTNLIALCGGVAHAVYMAGTLAAV